MTHFERRLNEALLGWHVGDTTPRRPGYSGASNTFRSEKYSAWGKVHNVNTAGSYASPKYYQTLSQKLSRLVHHDIIILVGNGLERYAGGPEGRLMRLTGKTVAPTLSAFSGIPEEAFRRAITLLIIGDQGQEKLSPWLILHQLAEAIVREVGDVWSEVVAKKYRKYLERVPQFVDDPEAEDDDPDEGVDMDDPDWERKFQVRAFQRQDERDSRLGHLSYYEGSDNATKAFHHLFRMKSAREFIHGAFDNIDPGQEIIVEYMWHGGRIRMNSPDWIPGQVVDSINQDLCAWIDGALTRLRGHRITNEEVLTYEEDS